MRARPAVRGVRFAAASPLAARAVALLEVRPRPSDEIAREVLGMRGAPPALARTLVDALLREQPRVRADDRGVWRLADAVAGGSTPLPRVPFTVVDVETTGGVAGDGGRIVEVAAVRVEEGELRDVFATLVDPGIPMPPWISRLTGISDAMLRDAPRFDDVCDELRRRVEDRVFVAHNAAYDWRFVGEEMRRARSVLPVGPRLCTVQLARRLLPGLERRGLDSLARFYGIEIEGRHRARGDAVATARALVRLIGEAERQGIATWGALRERLRDAGPRSGNAPGRGGVTC